MEFELTDEIEFVQKGIQTVRTLNKRLKRTLPENWYIDWPKYCEERQSRIEVINRDPLIRKFKLPIVYKTKVSYE